MTDVPAVTKLCHARGIVTIMDNTWGSPICFQPLKHGVDVSINAATKIYLGPFRPDARHRGLYRGGFHPGQEDCLRIRLLRRTGRCLHGAARPQDPADPDEAAPGDRGQQIALWLQQRPEVARVLYPALPDDPGHAIWKRDFDGASGLFGVVLNAC